MESGEISIFTGDSHKSEAGDFNIRGGSSAEGLGGSNISLQAGSSPIYGGSIHLVSGKGNQSSSGSIVIESSSAYKIEEQMESGDIELSTGSSVHGHTGALKLVTGHSSRGMSGDIFISSGTSNVTKTVFNDTASIFGSIILEAGNTTLSQSGGKVSITGGHALSNYNGDDIFGGNITIAGGSSVGQEASKSLGGSIHVSGGLGNSVGGNIVVESGRGITSNSGNINILSADSMLKSGHVFLKTGSISGTMNTTSGDIYIETGSSVHGDSGKISIRGGHTFSRSGGSLSLIAGSSFALNRIGG